MTAQPAAGVGEEGRVPFATVFARALDGEPCWVIDSLGVPRPLPVHAWTGPADAFDRELLRCCDGPTIDVGCGPGRLVAALTAAGQDALGIDLVPEAVRHARDRGAAAIRRDVFDVVPGEGRWHCALLADGNLGIGGDPVTLLRRARELVEPGGRVVTETAPWGSGLGPRRLSLRCGGLVSRPFPWAVVGADQVGGYAAAAGLQLDSVREHGDRWLAVLEKRR